jgi:glycosyltransferase involved in cell wall biosynthesis
MKLLICTTEFYPYGAGIANVVYNVFIQLKNMGVECTVCSPIGSDIQLGSRILIQKTGIIGLLYYWYQTTRFFKDNNYDIVWLHNPFIITNNPFKHCIVTMHSTYNGTSTQRIGNLPFQLYKSLVAVLERYCLRHMPHATMYTGVSRNVCLELEKIGIEKKYVKYIPNGVNTEKFQRIENKKKSRKKFGIPEDEVIMLSVGRLTPAKQPHVLIEIFSHIEKNQANIILYIAGSGELYKATKDLVKSKGLRKIIFLGYIDHDLDLPDLYGCADYYIMTSKYEGTPLTLLEAMASGLPCIVSKIPNLEIVIEANCGINVDFSNISAALVHILNYLKKDNHVHQINARDYAVRLLDWKIITEQYFRVFTGMLRYY